MCQKILCISLIHVGRAISPGRKLPCAKRNIHKKLQDLAEKGHGGLGFILKGFSWLTINCMF